MSWSRPCCDTYNLKQDCSRHDIQNYLKDNNVFVWVECFDFDKYGRVLANVYKEPDSMSLSDLLLNCKLAYAYDGGKKAKNWIINKILEFLHNNNELAIETWIF